MKVVKFTVMECPNTGDIGIRPEKMIISDDIFVPNSGIGVAHDLLEHVNGVWNIGSVEDELEALGAMWWIRGQWGVFNPKGYSKYTPAQVIAFEIASLIIDYGPLQAIDANLVTKPGHFEEDIEYIFDFAMEKLEEGWAHDWSDEHDKQQWIYTAKHFFRVGLRKARKRFPDSLLANNLFFEIVRVVDEVPFKDILEGQKFKLRYCLSSGFVSMEEYWDFDEY